MPVFAITVYRTMEQSGSVNIWAPNKDYVIEHRDEIRDEAAEYIDFETDDSDDSIGGITLTPKDRLSVDPDLVFGLVAEEVDEKEEPVPVLPGQLALEGM